MYMKNKNRIGEITFDFIGKPYECEYIGVTSADPRYRIDHRVVLAKPLDVNELLEKYQWQRTKVVVHYKHHNGGFTQITEVVYINPKTREVHFTTAGAMTPRPKVVFETGEVLFKDGI
jgi:hypothetical protein